MANFILVIEALGLTVGDIFTPTNDTEQYQSTQNPDVIIPRSTMDALPEYFLLEPSFTWDNKGAGIEAAQVDAVVWTPAVGEYFSTYENELDLWKILDDPDTDFSIVKITGNLTGIENPTVVPQAEFTNTRFQVFTPEAISGSSSPS